MNTQQKDYVDEAVASIQALKKDLAILDQEREKQKFIQRITNCINHQCKPVFKQKLVGAIFIFENQ